MEKNIRIKMLSHRTDFINGYTQEISDKGDYIVIKTHSHPYYFWGNYLIFPKEPQKGDYKKWTRFYEKEFGSDRGFMALTWDTSEEGETEEFIKSGFSLTKCDVLMAQEVIRPVKYNHKVEIRELSSTEDWEQYVEVHVNENWYLANSSQKKFLESVREIAKKVVESGKGKRFGAFLKGKLVADAGIYYDGNLGRYNDVATHLEYRRQGMCGTLIYNSARIAFEEMGLKTLVMVADADYHAARIYKSVGFKVWERQIELEWHDKNIH